MGAVATSDWQEICRSWTAEELSAEESKLKGQITAFNQQSLGARSWTVDLKELRDRL